MLGHKTNLNKLKKTDIISNIFSDHNGIKSITRRKLEKHTKKPKTKTNAHYHIENR